MRSDIWVRVTMLMATAAWAAGEALLHRAAPLDRLAKVTWTIGVALALVHIALAFQFVYGWDHEAAVQATMQQSRDRFGAGWRGGIYVNYIFVMFWVADVCWWWIAPASHHSRPLAYERVRFLFFVFMFVNGAIVFASGTGRLVGCIALGIALVGYLMPRTGAAQTGSDPRTTAGGA